MSGSLNRAPHEIRRPKLVAGQIVVAANTSDSYALGYDAVGHVTSRYVSYGAGDERVYRVIVTPVH